MLETVPRTMDMAAEMILQVDVARRRGCAEVIAAGEIDASVIKVFQEALRNAVALHEPVVLVDLTGVEYMDSGCVYALLDTYESMGRRKEAMQLRLGASPAARVIRTARLDQLMTIVRG